MIRRLLLATLALVLAACGASGGPATAGPATGGARPAPAPARTAAAPPAVSAPRCRVAQHCPPGAVPTTDVPATIDSCTVLSDEDIKLATNEGVTERKPSTLTRITFSSVCDITLDGGGELTVGRPALDRQAALGRVAVRPVRRDRRPRGRGARAGRRRGRLEVRRRRDGPQRRRPVRHPVHRVRTPGPGPHNRHLAGVVLDKLPCLATGCAGATAPPASTGGSTVDACALLTDQEDEGGDPLRDHRARGGPGDGLPVDAGHRLRFFPGLRSIRLAIQLTGGREQWDFLSQGLPQVPALGDGAFKLGGNTDGSIKALAGRPDRLARVSLPIRAGGPIHSFNPAPQERALARLPG